MPEPRSLRSMLLAFVVTTAGCGYSIRPPYDGQIRTVYVPMFQSQRFRRDLNQQITELVIKEIQNRTPYKVVSRPENADARLEGMIIFDDKSLMVENPNNLPRQLAAVISASVTFTDNRTGQTVTRNTPAVTFSQIEQFYPEVGHTAGVAFRHALARMAEDIVNTMEDPWNQPGGEPVPGFVSTRESERGGDPTRLRYAERPPDSESR